MSLKLSFVLAASLFAIYPSFALADPKSDIALYSAAFEAGEYEKGNELLSSAFDSVSKSLEIGNPILAKIAYDYSLNQVINNKGLNAKKAMDIFRRSAEKNPKIIENADLSEIELVENIVNTTSESNKKNSYADVAKLNRIIDSYAHNRPNDPIIFNGYYALLYEYQKLSEWRQLAKVSDELLQKLNQFPELGPQDRKTYEFLGYYFRGQGRFAAAILNLNVTKIGTFELLKDSKFWVQADADFHKAELIYGKPTKKSDKVYLSVAVWSNLMGAYYRSIENRYANEEAYKKAVKKDHELIFSAIGETKRAPEHLEKDSSCDGKIKIKFKEREFEKVAETYFFAAAAIAVDIEENGEQTNVRVLTSIPYDIVASVIVSSTSGQIATIEPNTPKECLRDYITFVTFITK